MAQVRVLPDDILIEAEDGQTIMDAAHVAGYYWPTTCGGQGICTSCVCIVEEGVPNLEPMGRGEHKTLAEDRSEATLASGKVRLACQARVRGEVTVTKRGVRREEA
ncbi:MAG: 2Fe-2S iron-sulfur cluster-binding protein [Chloroflexota bacterium]